MVNPDTKLLIQKMTDLEESIGRLYSIYQDLFPAQKGFWGSLAAEEKDHAEWISKFAVMAKHSTITIRPERFKQDVIQTSLDLIGKEIEKARKGKLSLLEALSTAFHLENALIEKEFFKIVKADSDELKSVLGRLSLATENHRRWIEQVWSTAKSGRPA
jgi:hypothetical protein